MDQQLVKIEFTPEQEQLIKKQLAPNATNDELKIFLYQCKRTGLDPFTRQIYCIHRGGKMTIQTSIDGFRVIAERSGEYAGQSEPEFIEDNGKIVCCKVRVFKFSKTGVRYEAAVGVAYWDEYAQSGPMWQKMKHTMISKCAEAVALRKAFPQDLSGLYTGDEMQQADAPIVEDSDFSNVPTVGERQQLINMVYSSTLTEDKKEETIEWIQTKCHTYKEYELMHNKLEMVQPSIDEIQNPSQKDLNKHLSKVTA